MAGPLLAGWLYSGLGHPAPYWLGAVLIAMAVWALVRATAGRPGPADAVV
jgi:uncharacterized membrane protein AbrB (regulator of aidB expression)